MRRSVSASCPTCTGLRRTRRIRLGTAVVTQGGPVQFSPAAPGLDEAITALELLATEVAPALGWKPETR